jgi:RNA polymerase sigma factor (sigma-70 family)
VDGDLELYGDLLRGHQAAVLGLCVAILADPHEAEDAAQAVFLKAYQALPRFQGQASFRTWVTRIAINQCKDRLRQRRRQRAQSLDAWMEAGKPLPAALVQEPAAPESAALPVEVLERLSPGERGLLELLLGDSSLSYAELGQRLGLSLDGVKGRLKRAREKLRGLRR